MITDSQSLEGKSCCAGIHGASGFPDSQCDGCCSQPGSSITVGFGTDLLDGRSNSCNTSEIVLHVDLNLDPSEDLGHQKLPKVVATSRMEGSLSSSCVVSRGRNFGVNPLDMSLDHMNAKSCIPGSIRGSTSFVAGQDRRDRLLSLSACADSFQFKQKRTQNGVNLNSSGSTENAVQQDEHFVSDAQTPGKPSLDSAIFEERSRETSLKQNNCVYKRRKVRHSETLVREHMKTALIKGAAHIGDIGCSPLTQLEKNQNLLEANIICKRQNKRSVAGPETLYPEKNGFSDTYLNGKRNGKRSIVNDQNIDSENDGNFSEEEILKRDDKRYAICTSNIVIQPEYSVESSLSRKFVNENCLGNLGDCKVHTLSFYSNSDRKDTNNENGVEDTCESNFTTGYCATFPNQGSPSPKKLTYKMGRIIDTTHGEICGSGACASYCMDATEVAEEKDPEREWCISILKESNLLAYLSSDNAAAMEHPGVVGDGKCNKKCKVCRTLEDSTSTLICDMCEESFHMSCCNPKIISIPTKDNWYCTPCRKKRKRPVIKYSIESRENEYGRKFRTGVLDKGVHDKVANEKGGDILWRMLQDDGAYTTQVRIGSEYQADVPLWTGKVTDSVESPFMGEPISVEEKTLEQELAEHNMENGIGPKDWRAEKFLSFGAKENWLQCQAVLYYEGELCPDGRKAKQDIICGKWRRAPSSQVQNDSWDCSCAVVWDPVHADCAVPQEMETEDILKLLKASEMVFPECKLSKEDWGFERDE